MEFVSSAESVLRALTTASALVIAEEDLEEIDLDTDFLEDSFTDNSSDAAS